jgi:hypothetical protein
LTGARKGLFVKSPFRREIPSSCAYRCLHAARGNHCRALPDFCLWQQLVDLAVAAHGFPNLGTTPSGTPMKYKSSRMRISAPITISATLATRRNGSYSGTASIK